MQYIHVPIPILYKIILHAICDLPIHQEYPIIESFFFLKQI